MSTGAKVFLVLVILGTIAYLIYRHIIPIPIVTKSATSTSPSSVTFLYDMILNGSSVKNGSTTNSITVTTSVSRFTTATVELSLSNCASGQSYVLVTLGASLIKGSLSKTTVTCSSVAPYVTPTVTTVLKGAGLTGSTQPAGFQLTISGVTYTIELIEQTSTTPSSQTGPTLTITITEE